MTRLALTQQDVLSHQHHVPWPELHQVEQDLLLSLAMHAIFEDRFLASQVAMRGGTVLHKVQLAPAARYSEDIDLVVVGERPEDHVKKALMRVLRPILGKEKSSAWESVRLAVRNAVKPSRILRCIYLVPSVSEPGRRLKIEVETNVTERRPSSALQHLPFALDFRGDRLATNVISYDLNEMLGTKMRALFQRKKGRDLFDLYWALTNPTASPAVPESIAMVFRHYMRDEDTLVPREEFLAHLRECLADRAGFCADMRPLLRVGIEYDPLIAGAFLEKELLSKLPP